MKPTGLRKVKKYTLKQKIEVLTHLINVYEKRLEEQCYISSRFICINLRYYVMRTRNPYFSYGWMNVFPELDTAIVTKLKSHKRGHSKIIGYQSFKTEHSDGIHDIKATQYRLNFLKQFRRKFNKMHNL